MIETAQFLAEYGGPALFGIVLVEQLGLPLPAMPWLLAAGALSVTGAVNPVMAVAVTVLACLVADSVWFYFGRRMGKRVLHWLCRVSLEPDCSVKKGEGFLSRHAAAGLVAAKFVPGLGAVIAPLAAVFGMSYRRFLFFDGLGASLYASSYVLLGFLFSEELQQLLGWMGRFGFGALALLVSVVAVYVLFKLIRRRRKANADRQDAGPTAAPVRVAQAEPVASEAAAGDKVESALIVPQISSPV